MKTILKNALFVAMEWLGANAYFRHRNKGRVKVLLFHSISPPGLFFGNAVSADSFAQQLEYLSKRYSILRLTQEGQLSGYEPTKVNILLTFDDGFIDNYAVAAPILARFNMSATFFVIAECLPEGRPPSFIMKRLGGEPNLDVYRTFTTTQAQELLTMGMTIGSHSVSHIDYTTISAEAGTKDALESRVLIEAAMGVPISSFAFPWGRLQEQQAETLKRSYRRIFITEHGFNSINDFIFNRNEVANLSQLRCAASGALDYFSALVGNRVAGSPTKQKRILIVLPDLRGGGAERLHINLAKHWRSQGVEITFALLKRRGEWLCLLQEDVGIVDLGADKIRQAILPLARYMRSARPDIVIAAIWPLTSVATLSWWLAGKPGHLYLSDHNHLSISSTRETLASLSKVSLAIRLTYPLASGVIAVSEEVKKDICQLGRLPDSLVRVIYNPAAIGASPHRESIGTQQELWGVDFDHHILSVGSLKEQKDFATLIKAFAQLPFELNAKLTILGEGPLRLELDALVKQLGMEDRVAMPGFVIDPYPWFRSADLFVLSSLWEGFGNVIVEALECGVPVVSTDCPSGPAEILDHGRFGRLVPIQNPTALASEMAKALAAPVDRELLMRRAKDFSVGAISEQYLAYFFEAHNSVVEST